MTKKMRTYSVKPLEGETTVDVMKYDEKLQGFKAVPTKVPAGYMVISRNGTTRVSAEGLKELGLNPKGGKLVDPDMDKAEDDTEEDEEVEE